MLTDLCFTLAPSYIEYMMSIKNHTEIDGMRRAYLRDGVSFARFPYLFNSGGDFDSKIPLGEIPSMARG